MEITRSPNRLDNFRVRLPACDQFVRSCVDTKLGTSVRLATGKSIEFPLPFFWFDPPWHLVPIEKCRTFAHAFAASGIVVSSLHRDLAADEENKTAWFLPRLAPHRCDRAGWTFRDFESASVIDLRLAPIRDEIGRFAYHPAQLNRWRNFEEDRSHDAVDATDAMTFPPDWKNVDSMCSKVGQLRRLSDAAIFVSIDEVHAPVMLLAAKAADVDGVIIRVEGDPLQTIVRARQQIDSWKRPISTALWVVTSEQLSPVDCVKCFAMGASGLSVDLICNDLLFQNHLRLEAAVNQVVGELADSVRGYANSCNVAQITDLRPDHLGIV